MFITIRADDSKTKELQARKTAAGVTINWLQPGDDLCAFEAGAYIDLAFEETTAAPHGLPAGKVVLVNAVCSTGAEIGAANCIRINGWNGFLNRSLVEVACSNSNTRNLATQVLDKLGWPHVWAPDQPGMIAPRVISMIINEAYFSLGEGVSSRPEIDMAMKLGTNYPFGPFEWAEKIGLKNIYFLLKKLLQQYGKRYVIAPLLQQEAIANGAAA